ncbi:hypothetical protein [Acetobacter cerevisiae]|uniref:hypothetical protein n=1 Tax=Acetobacter cerevisiae TaxID=178900 RepID=UPI0012E73676|nr:hypothetical protein [Acetobacter cerevisiae]
MLLAFEIALFLFLMPAIIAVVSYLGMAILYVIGVMLCALFSPTILGFSALMKSKEQYEDYCIRQKKRKQNGTYKKIYWYYPACFVGGIILFFCGVAYGIWFISYIVNYCFS